MNADRGTGKVSVGVTGAGSLIGQAIIKSIVRSESGLRDRLRLVGFDPFAEAMGLAWVDEPVLLPNMLADDYREETWLEALTGEIDRLGIEVLLVGLDFELPVLARHRTHILEQTGCDVVVSDPGVVLIADDKYHTYRFLKEHGLPYPASWLPEEVDPAKLTYPVVVKPRRGARSRGVSVVNDPEELPHALHLADEPVIQELVGDDSDEYTCGVICFDGAVERSVALRRTLAMGNTETAFYSASTPDAIHEYLHEVASRLAPRGACNFQLRLGDDGVPRVFEINARHSGTTYMRSLFGYLEVEYILCRLLGWPLPEFQMREGRVRRYFEEVFVAGSPPPATPSWSGRGT